MRLLLAVYALICSTVYCWGADAPRLVLRISPRVQLFTPGQTVYVRATLRILDPDQALGCFRITWTWGDGCRSVEESDCDPYLLIEERPKLYVPIPRIHAYRRPGVFAIVVVVRAYPVTSAGRVTARTQQIAMVLESSEQ